MALHLKLKKTGYQQKPFLYILERLSQRPWLTYGVGLFEEDIEDDVGFQILGVNVGEDGPNTAEVFNCLTIFAC